MTFGPSTGLLRSLDRVPASLRDRWPLGIAAFGLPVALFALLADVPAYAVAALLFQLAASPTIALGMTRGGRPLTPGWALIASAEAVLPLTSMLMLAGHSLEPHPVLHAAYLSGYLLLAVGMALLVGGHDREGGLGSLLDALIVAIGFLFVVYFAVIDPGFESGHTSGSQGSLIISLIYPGVDTWLLAMAVRLIFDRGQVAPWHLLMLGAVAAPLVSDVLRTASMANGTYVPGQPSDVVVALGSLLWAAAALHPSAMADQPQARRTRRTLPRVRLIMVALALFIAPAILVATAAGSGEDMFSIDNDQLEIAGGSIVLSGLVIIRLFAALSRLDGALHSREKLEKELKRQALRDGLTDLPNRTMFTQRLEIALARNPDQVAVLFCDLDDFKTVNDTLGHALGDELLVAVAGRLRSSLRPTDLAARLGGDEFAILLEQVGDANGATGVADRLVNAFRDPVTLGGQPYAVRVSIGVALGAGAIDPAELMRNADIAMYLAKSQGKGRYELFHPGMQASVVNRLALRASLERAIEKQEFALQYQPIKALSSDQIVGVEALVRWHHPDRGQIPPGEFIPLAEQVGLIVPLGRWVLRTACRQLRVWLDDGAAATLSMSVNVSPVQLADPEFVRHVREAIADAGIVPTNLVLELTEGALIDADGPNRVLGELKALGIRLAVDDFGTGYSAMSYLGRFPIDILKIDRSFVSAIGRDEREAALVSTIIRLASNLQLDTVAEGIEDLSQLDELRGLGCEFGQGYLLGRPLDPGVAGAVIARTAERSDPPRAA
jgi:diguanylate cyclase (GGDEF)-like protein